MITTLSALLASKYGKYALEVLIVFGLVCGAYLWAENRGRNAQKVADDQRHTQQIEQSRKEAQDAKDQLVKQSKDNADKADARAQLAEDHFNSLAAQLQGIFAQQKAGSDRVKGLADSEVHGDVVAQLKLRPAGDATACYTPREERAIDDAITQWPLCRQQSEKLSQQVTEQQTAKEAAKDKVADKQQAIDALQLYIKQLEHDYQELHDQHPPRYRGAGCLWLWKCGVKKVDFSNRAQAAQVTPAGSSK